MVFLICSPIGERVFIKSPNKLVAGAVFNVSPLCKYVVPFPKEILIAIGT